jgi:DNA-binding transcriptional MerR regulator
MADLVTLAEMAKMLGIHPDTLRDYHLRGIVPSYKISQRVLRFDPAEVREAIRQNNFNKKKREKHGHL